MVNFRFHLVSLVAVFLALALGIGMGATVIDKATVDSLKARVTAVENDRNNANQRADALQTQINRNNSFDESTRAFITNGKLDNVSVVLLAVRGIDNDSLNATQKLITSAGGAFQGTIWFPTKDNLVNSKDANQLQTDISATSNDPTVLRQSMMALVSAVMAGASSPAALKPLVDDGFLEWDGAAGGSDITRIELASTRILVASGYQPAVPNDELAIPLTKLLAVQPNKRVVAIEAGTDASGNTPAERAVFLDPLRSDGSLKNKLSTVDDLENSDGQVAAILSLWQLAGGRTGNYGVASSADSATPVPAS